MQLIIIVLFDKKKRKEKQNLHIENYDGLCITSMFFVQQTRQILL